MRISYFLSFLLLFSFSIADADLIKTNKTAAYYMAQPSLLESMKYQLEQQISLSTPPSLPNIKRMEQCNNQLILQHTIEALNVEIDRLRNALLHFKQPSQDK